MDAFPCFQSDQCVEHEVKSWLLRIEAEPCPAHQAERKNITEAGLAVVSQERSKRKIKLCDDQGGDVSTGT